MTATNKRCLPATRHLHNQARTMAEQYFATRYRQEYLDIGAQMKKDYPHLSPGGQRSRVFTVMRARRRLEYGRIFYRCLQMRQEAVGYVDGRKSNGRPIPQLPEYVVPCEHCHAGIGEPCRKPNRAISVPHRARVMANQPSAAPSR